MRKTRKKSRTKLEPYHDNKVYNSGGNGVHISFETRVISSVLVVFILFALACLLVIKTFGIFDNTRIFENVWTHENIVGVGVACSLIIVALIVLFRVTRLVLKVTNSKSDYEKDLELLLKKYDDIIVVRDDIDITSFKEVVKVNSFIELLDVRNSDSDSIIFSKINDIKCQFIVDGDLCTYVYVMKDVD